MQIKHKKCGGTVFAGMPLYLKAVTLSFEEGRLNAASAVLISKSGRLEAGPQKATFICSKCDKQVDSAEMAITCPQCGKTHPVTECIASGYTPFVGKECVSEYLIARGIPSSAVKLTPAQELIDKGVLWL